MIPAGLATGLPPSGAGAYGFQVPQGDVGELEAAARACARWAAALGSRATSVRTGAQEASTNWTGSAENSFAGAAAHLAGVYDSLAEVVGDAGRTLSTFAQELATAQRLTEQALQECEASSRQAMVSQQEAAAHGQTAQTLSAQVAAAVHPAARVELARQLNTAQDQQAAAQRAADDAQNQLRQAERQGARAWTEYQHQAQAAARTLQGLSARIQKVERLPGASSATGQGAGEAGGGAGALGFWPVFNAIAGSEASDATIGLGEGILLRYRESDLVLPITKQASQALERFSGELGAGDPFTLLPMGLWVGKGSSADPVVQELQSATAGEGFNTPGKPFFAVGEEDLSAAAPSWATIAGRSLGVVGVGLTFYSTGADEWEYDSAHHPGWSTTEKALDTAQTTAVVGGSTVTGALLGAEAGAEGGAAAGAAIGSVVPLVGTAAGGVVGGVVGGVAGGLVGGGIGRAIGHGFESAGHAVAHAVSKVWNSIF